MSTASGHNHIDESVLSRYILGETSGDESAEIAELIEKDAAVREQFMELSSLIGKYDQGYIDDQIDLERAKNKFLELTEEENKPEVKARTRTLGRWLVAAAASVALLIGLFYIFKPVKTIELVAGTEKIEDFRLPDGSRLWLNAGSVLSYPEQFKGKVRKVELRGEGFFEVAAGEPQPFIIETGQVSIEVIGTRFNVKADPSDDKVLVTVEEGKVAAYFNNEEEKTVISKGETVEMNKVKQTVDVQNITDNNYNAWKTGELKFRDTRLVDAVKVIEEYYNVQITLNDPVTEDYTLTSSFKDENLESVLEVICIIYGLNIQHNEEEIILSLNK